MSQFTINNMVFDSESDMSDSTFDPDDYDSCYSDTELILMKGMTMRVILKMKMRSVKCKEKSY